MLQLSGGALSGDVILAAIKLTSIHYWKWLPTLQTHLGECAVIRDFVGEGPEHAVHHSQGNTESDVSVLWPWCDRKLGWWRVLGWGLENSAKNNNADMDAASEWDAVVIDWSPADFVVRELKYSTASEGLSACISWWKYSAGYTVLSSCFEGRIEFDALSVSYGTQQSVFIYRMGSLKELAALIDQSPPLIHWLIDVQYPNCGCS